jgi:predicted aminopeptidase
VALLIPLSACSTASYLVHVSLGQMRTLLDRELLDADRVARLSAEERAGLDTVRAAQAFGATLGLAQSGSYRHVIDRNRETAVRVVTAAPANRLEPVTWWFPVVGRVAYRGYFDGRLADRFADSLAQRGFDTYVRPALMYSTVGYFDDPIPLAVLRWPEIDLIDVTLHELVHETIFVAGDTQYNETLASFISEKATLLYSQDDPEQRDLALRQFADRRRFARMLGDLAGELETLYAGLDSAAAAREQRRAVFARFQQEVFPAAGFETQRYAGFAVAALSNSYVLAVRTYSADMPCFELEFVELGEDLRSFIAAHRASPGRRADSCADPATGATSD